MGGGEPGRWLGLSLCRWWPCSGRVSAVLLQRPWRALSCGSLWICEDHRKPPGACPVGEAECASCKLELIPVPCGTRALTVCLALCYVLSGSPAWPCVFWGDRLVPFAQDFPCFKTVIPGSKEAPPAWANPDGWSSLSSHAGKFCLMATLSIRAKTALLIARYLGLLLSTLERWLCPRVVKRTVGVPAAPAPFSLPTQAASSLLCYSSCLGTLFFSCLSLSGFGKEKTIAVKENSNKVVWAQNISSCLFAQNSRSLY